MKAIEYDIPEVPIRAFIPGAVTIILNFVKKCTATEREPLPIPKLRDRKYVTVR